MSTVRKYELIYIAPPEASEELLGELHELVTGVVEQFGGTIESTENWGRRKLAYEISGQREGVYVLEVINGPGGLNVELDRRLKVADQVMRHMVVRVDKEMAATERIQARRKQGIAARRTRRGLPPEPVVAETPAPAVGETPEPAVAETPAPEPVSVGTPEAQAEPPAPSVEPPAKPVPAEAPSEGGKS
jgi:small subunit ribosomal protein S6